MLTTIPHTDDPIGLFRAWLKEAEASEPDVPNALCLATVGPGNRPSARMVLLKELGAKGFVFYTNSESRKGTEIAQNPFASACFHWKSLGRQVRIEGRLAQVTAAEADAYWNSRPRGSQIAAWASDQSRPLEGRGVLESRVRDVEARFKDQPVPRPPHWLGYALDPELIEFWLNVANRLHDRLAFTRESRGWRAERLHP